MNILWYPTRYIIYFLTHFADDFTYTNYWNNSDPGDEA